MFPRVIGRIAGQFVSTVCEGYGHAYRAAEELLNNNLDDTIQDGFRRVITDAALLTLAPAPLRPWIAAYRAWNAWNHPPTSLQEDVQDRSAQLPTTPEEKGLACYLNALEQSDPFLISPFGTMPLDNCR